MTGFFHSAGNIKITILDSQGENASAHSAGSA
jgi:hypothetical protein